MTPLAWQVIIWMIAGGIAATWRMRRGDLSVGLALGYITNLWLIHWPSALSYVFPWSAGAGERELALGFEQSTYGIVGFAIGVVIAGPALLEAINPPGKDSRRHEPNASLPFVYLGIGVAAYFVLGPLLGGLPTVAAISVGLRQLIVVGLCLLLWHAWFAKQRRRFIAAFAAMALLPATTILRDGFLSYGAMAVICIISFLAVFFRPRIVLVVMLGIILYGGFSFYVTYMRDRTMLRDAVWGGSDTAERLGQFKSTFTDVEFFNPFDANHWYRINTRLDQNSLVGLAVENLDDHTVDFARGKTIIDGLFAFIPRAIWPDKPSFAGSGSIVSDYTKLHFAEGTSVGVGQVMEFYVNFGTWGVVIGFIIFGAIITILDAWAARNLWNGDWLQFALWYLPGVALMQTGGSLVEVTSSTAAAIAGVFFVNKYIVPLRVGARPVPKSVTA